MPPGIATARSLEKRPSAKDRREMVRILVDEMRLNEPNPSKSQCQTIAKMIVKQHPKSFVDVMRDGTVIGSGYGSFLTQLKTRVEHVNRGNALSRRWMPKRVSNAPEDIARGPADQYGFVRWQSNCPPGETVEGLEEKKSEMKDLYHTEGPAGAERAYVIQLMKTTYYLQRKHINACPPPSVSELKSEWPYLFIPRELYSHFNLLTDINILRKMEQAMEEKGKLILKFFQHRPAGTSADKVERILVKYSKEEKCDPCPCVILLLMAHFKEKSEGLILQTDLHLQWSRDTAPGQLRDDNVLNRSAEGDDNVLNRSAEGDDNVFNRSAEGDDNVLPSIGDVFTATNWMLSIEGHVVVGPHQNIVAGLAALFACYYAFNLVYQEEASNTLEFIQRCFLGINPTSGTKATKWISPRSGKVQEKRNSNVSLHVSALLRRLMDFEWF
ncbi:uncharacterized protein LOC125307588 [Alosa alosa]|uniref:uncharacterized protein LOC125307588 n=1 Tax=Alosa alosa TaxID=278164 RepID=UPI002015294E|nr:uncharacterized protein LOC125307588 [Alosa alosa]